MGLTSERMRPGRLPVAGWQRIIECYTGSPPRRKGPPWLLVVLHFSLVATNRQRSDGKPTCSKQAWRVEDDPEETFGWATSCKCAKRQLVASGTPSVREKLRPIR